MSKPFDRLKNASAITLGGSLMPGAGAYGVGAVACVMPNQADANAWIKDQAEGLLSLDQGPAGVIAVGDPWTFMRRAAGEGLAGIEGANAEVFRERFMFMVRVEEAGAMIPTVLTSITAAGWDVSLTRGGIKHLRHSELLHWQRYDILDKVTGRWGQRCPFRQWDHGDVLYELRSDDLVVLLADVPLLGDWNSTEGAFAFFTSEQEAAHYHSHHLGDGRNRMVSVTSRAPNDPHEAMASLRPRPVADLQIRLSELAGVNPFAAWCVNPDGHRENSAYGRLRFGDSEPARMGAVSGIWKVMPGNALELEQSLQPWTGNDTIRWSGGQSIQLLPLDRSFVVDPGLGAIGLDEDLTESEAEELVAAHLDSIGLNESKAELAMMEQQSHDRMEQFHLVCWDTVTGDGADHPWRFPGFLGALKHLSAFEREHDRYHRIEGAVSCGHIGFSGSGDTEFEHLRSARFHLGLERLAHRVLRRGYQPADAEDLVALCNSVLVTLHIDYAGYTKDLLWASSSAQVEGLLAALELDEDAWRRWAESAEVPIDAEGEKLVVSRVGTAAWARLCPQVRHFLATAILNLERQGHAPQLDYAPICIEVVKALEVELGGIFEGFRTVLGNRDLKHEPDDLAEKMLSAFLEGRKPPTLGQFSYLLRASKENDSELRRTLHEYLLSLSNGSFLTSSKFAKRGLQRVINKYRNGGAHDSPISEEICRECVDVLIGSRDNPGFIFQASSWKP